jgi:hypothetical protein
MYLDLPLLEHHNEVSLLQVLQLMGHQDYRRLSA